MIFNCQDSKLVYQVASPDEKAFFEKKAKQLVPLQIHNRYGCDCEMIANGGFSPLEGFMGKKDAESVINKMTLCNGTTWSILILLPINSTINNKIQTGDEVS